VILLKILGNLLRKGRLDLNFKAMKTQCQKASGQILYS